MDRQSSEVTNTAMYNIPGNPENDAYGLITSYHEKVLLRPDENVYEPNDSGESLRTGHPCKCDKTPFEFVDPIFDYCKFSSFLQAKSLLERQKRIKMIELDEPVLQVSDLTDDLLLKEMTSIYGILDTRSDLFDKLFQNYKLERIEQIETWCQEEKEYYASNIAAVDNEESDIINSYLDSFFTPEELKKFDQVSQLDSTEYFVLPRRVPSNQKFDCKKKPTLNTFDPELHIPFMIPPICDVKVGEILARGIHEIVKSHPTGITCSQFVSEFEHQKSYRLNVQSMNYSNFMEMIDDLSHHILLVQKCENNTILYPMFLQGLICTLDDAFFHIFHKVKVILNLSYGILKLSEAIKICENIFGWNSVDFKAWGFRSEQDFVSYLAKRWRTDRLAIVSEDKIIPKGDSQVLYLLEVTDERKKLLRSQEEKLNSSNKVKNVVMNPTLKIFHETAKSIPSRFMQTGHTIPDEMSNYRVGDVLSMVATFHISPTDFYMVQNNKFSEIMDLNRKLKAFCEHEESINTLQNLMINPTLISSGYCCILIDENGEYYRAEYQQKEDELFKCQLIDYGDVVTVPLQNLRYLCQKLATKLPGQAFHCRLMDVTSTKKDKNGGDIWEENIKDFSYNLMVPDRDNPHELKVFLKQYLVNHSARQRTWIVWMCDRKRKIKDFGASLRDFISKNVSLSQQDIMPDKKATNIINKEYAPNSESRKCPSTSNAQEKAVPLSTRPFNPFSRPVEKSHNSSVASLEDFPPLDSGNKNVNTSSKCKQKSKWKK